MKEDPLEALTGIKLVTAVAGFLGGVIQLMWHRHLSVWGALVSVLAGTCTAAFVTPLLDWYLTLPVPAENGVAFLCGLLGMLLTGKLYEWASRMTFENIVDWLLRRAPRKEDEP